MARPKTELVPLASRWAAELDTDAPLPEYPRPQLRRERWANLNGVWSFAVTPRDAGPPTRFDETIVVPFPVESALSGVSRRVGPDERVWYRRSFLAPSREPGERLLLHFGAVDFETEVFVNGRSLAVHEGGFDPFHVDVSDALSQDGPQELVVGVWDPTDQGQQAFGKQSLEPFLIVYTAVTGIWQTVWLEPVPAAHVTAVVAQARLASRSVSVDVGTAGTAPGVRAEVVARAAGSVAGRGSAPVTDGCARVELTFDALRAWCPEDPFLYDLEIVLTRGSEVLDRVESYFGAREIGTGLDEAGVQRIFLNGEPVFQLGPLDQGYWPDGLYTAPSDEALAFDLEATRRMGFNLVRKHVKVEPARWYWHADRLGLLVWQDLPNSERCFDLEKHAELHRAGIAPEDAEWDLERGEESAALFHRELDAMLRALAPFACIVVWVPFNEGWGQFDTDAVLARVAERDPTRLVDGPSGWKDTGSGDLLDLHMYDRGEILPAREPHRPLVYGEFGGIKFQVDGHLAVREGWGYVKSETPEALAERYAELLETTARLAGEGLAAAIYTQTTDVESELNGLLSYDRAVFKIDPERLAPLHRRVIAAGSRSRT